MSMEVNTAVPMEDTNGAGASSITVDMSQLIAGVSTVFGGVVQMLEALDPQASGKLSIAVTKRYPEDEEQDAPAKEKQKTPAATSAVPTAGAVQEPNGEKAAAKDVKKEDIEEAKN